MYRSFQLTLCVITCAMSGCLFGQRPGLPVDNSVVRDQLVIYTDFDLPRRHRLINEMVALRSLLASKLQLPTSDEPIHVYLFDSSKQYRKFMGKHYSDFADRRAFFVKTDTTLTVYAHWNDRVAEDLQHEVAHGYLHSIIPNLPLWLDEGLAEYFEVPRGLRGVNAPHVKLLMEQYTKDRWTPDLERLEQLTVAIEMDQMDYAESWLWVHILLESTPERLEVIRKNLKAMRDNGSAEPLSKLVAEIEPSPQRSLFQHLKAVAED